MAGPQSEPHGGDRDLPVQLRHSPFPFPGSAAFIPRDPSRFSPASPFPPPAPSAAGARTELRRPQRARAARPRPDRIPGAFPFLFPFPIPIPTAFPGVAPGKTPGSMEEPFPDEQDEERSRGEREGGGEDGAGAEGKRPQPLLNDPRIPPNPGNSPSGLIQIGNWEHPRFVLLQGDGGHRPGLFLGASGNAPQSPLAIQTFSCKFFWEF